MRLSCRFMLAAGFSLLASSCFLSAQAVGPTQVVAASVELPESPNPALTLESAELEQQASPAQDAPASAPQSTASPAPPATAAPAQSSSTQQAPAPQSSGQKSQHDIADQQVHDDHQRDVGDRRGQKVERGAPERSLLEAGDGVLVGEFLSDMVVEEKMTGTWQLNASY